MDLPDSVISSSRDRFLAAFNESIQDNTKDYIKAIQTLLPAVAQQGVVWLQQIVDSLCSRAAAKLTSLDMFKTT